MKDISIYVYCYSNMELINIEILQSLVHDPHLSRTAARFRLTQSALSKRLQKLEDELQVKLFDRRGPRGLEATPAAKEISNLGEKVLLSWNSGLEKVRRHQSEPAHFGMVGPQIFMREVIAPWWAREQNRFKELSLEVHISALSRVSFELVQAGMDVGVLEHREDLADFICKPFFTENWGIVSHIKAPEPNLDDSRTLKKLTWLTVSAAHNPVDDWLVKRQKMPPPTYHTYWNDLSVLASMISEIPKSASVLPLHACRSLIEEKRLKFTPLGRDSKRTLYLAYRQNHPHKGFIQELLSLSEYQGG